MDPTTSSSGTPSPKRSPRKRFARRIAGLALLAALIVGGGYLVARGLRAVIEATAERGGGEVPTTTVRRGDIEITVSARGELQGGRAEELNVPRAGTAELPIIFLRNNGEVVEPGDVVAEFDSSGQDFALVEAEADLAQATQELLQAEAQARVSLEQARLQLRNAELDLQIAELNQVGNELLAPVEVRQNEIAFERARNRHAQAAMDLEHDEATSDAGLEARRAAVREAEERAETARRTMADLTLRAGTGGYVQLAENTSGLSIIYAGMTIPTFQLGDMARPGQTVARIPDMTRFEVSAEIPETDRAFLEVGQEAVVRPKAIPGREFSGRINFLGGSSGNSYNRTFGLRVALDDTDPDLRPGMSVDLIVRVETLSGVLWVPSQAVFQSEGRWFVYRQEPGGYITDEITLVRRTESQAVVSGIEEGTTIALARPGQNVGTESGSGGALGALPK